MGYNFRPVERDQQFLLPPSLVDWLPKDDLAWFVIDLVEMLDLGAIRSRYRADGWGAQAFDPALMTALLLYAYTTGERSSRRIEDRCRRDIGYRVVCATQVPDHATIARFRTDHEIALAELFHQVLALCAAAGLAKLGLLALDGTKIGADASLQASKTAEGLDAEIAKILAEAAATDAAEDQEFGPDRRGDELPPELTDRGSRLARLREARRQIEADAASRQARYATQVSERAALPPAERTLVRPPTRPPARPTRGNPTDPDSRTMRDHGAFRQAYNAQAVASEDGVIVAAELSQDPNDAALLGPMLEATRTSLTTAGVEPVIGTLLADGGYWSEAAVASLPAGTPELLIRPTVGRPRSSDRPPPRWRTPAKEAMRARLETEAGKALYKRRGAIIESVFGQLKEARGIRRFRRRGRTACWSEWRLACTTHNLLKLWRQGRQPPPPPRRPRSRVPRSASSPPGHPSGTGQLTRRRRRSSARAH